MIFTLCDFYLSFLIIILNETKKCMIVPTKGLGWGKELEKYKYKASKPLCMN